MKNFNTIVGIDVSKANVDLALIRKQNVEQVTTARFANTTSGMKEALKWLKSQPQQFRPSQTLFCMEHTGIYCKPVLDFWGVKSNVWVQSAIEIKQSSGLQRGKSDKLDAIRIATYALKNQQNAILWHPTENSLEQLQTLITTRNRLLKVRKMLEVPIQELQQFNPAAAATMQAYSAAAIEQLALSLKEIERQIQALIRQHESLNRNYQLSLSVPGVGPVTACLLLAYTQNFERFESAKQLACFCGVVPFEHTSGTSIKGRNRVSHMANKRLKTALHMAAMQAMQGKSDLALYYQRKAKEGKNKMSILNAMRNKILHRIFSVVKRGTPYQITLNAA